MKESSGAALGNTAMANSTVVRVAADPTAYVRSVAARTAFFGVALLAVSYAAFFTFLSFRRYDSFQTWAFDLGNMDQAVWNTIHGRLLAFTNMDGVTSRLAIHVEPTLVLISPIYLLWSDPKALLVLQTVALASGAFPVYWLARQELKSEAAALILAAGYLLFPSLEAVNYAEFHAVALSAPLLLWAFYLARNDRWPGYCLASLLAIGTKEEVGLVVATMGIYLALQKRSIWPLFVTALGVAWSFFAVFVVIASYNPTHTSPYDDYYSYLGDGLSTIAANLLRHPWVAFDRTVADPQYLASLLVPSGFLALLSPERLLMGLSSFMINVLSDDVPMHAPNVYHYTAPLIPALVLASIRGVDRARAILERIGLQPRQALVVVMAVYLTSTLLYQRADGLTPLSRSLSIPTITMHDRIGYEVLAQVPKDASLSVQSELNSHLSERQNLYVFPDVGDAEYVLADRFRDGDNPDPVGDPSLNQRHRLSVLADLVRGGKYAVILDRDGYMLLKRNS